MGFNGVSVHTHEHSAAWRSMAQHGAAPPHHIPSVVAPLPFASLSCVGSASGNPTTHPHSHTQPHGHSINVTYLLVLFKDVEAKFEEASSQASSTTSKPTNPQTHSHKENAHRESSHRAHKGLQPINNNRPVLSHIYSAGGKNHLNIWVRFKHFLHILPSAEQRSLIWQRSTETDML